MSKLIKSACDNTEIGDYRITDLWLNNYKTLRYQVRQWNGKYWEIIGNPYKTKNDAIEQVNKYIGEV